MADSLKRVSWAKDAQNQDRCKFYLFQKAQAILIAENATPGSQDADQVAYARAVFAGSVNLEMVGMVVVQNETIGAVIDAGNAVEEGSIQWVIFTDQWSNLAKSYAASQGV